MITEKQYTLIDSVLAFENAGEVVKCLVKEYAEKNPTEILSLIKLNNDLITVHTKHLEQLNNEALHALQWSVCNTYFLKKKFEVSRNEDFVIAITACKALFPEGKVSYASQLEQQYFNSMVAYLKSHLSEYLDSDWAEMYGCNSYIKLITSEKGKDE
jgi:hypothetical protein